MPTDNMAIIIHCAALEINLPFKTSCTQFTDHEKGMYRHRPCNSTLLYKIHCRHSNTPQNREIPNPNFRLRSRCSAYITKLPITSPNTDCINRLHGIMSVPLISTPTANSIKSSVKEKIPDRYRAANFANSIFRRSGTVSRL